MDRHLRWCTHARQQFDTLATYGPIPSANGARTHGPRSGTHKGRLSLCEAIAHPGRAIPYQYAFINTYIVGVCRYVGGGDFPKIPIMEFKPLSQRKLAQYLKVPFKKVGIKRRLLIWRLKLVLIRDYARKDEDMDY